MSSIKNMISGAASRSPRSSVDHTTSEQEADDYRLLVTAGPSYDTNTHKVVHVNTSQPTIVSNEFLEARIKVRIRGYRGLPSDSPSSSPYFDDPIHAKDQYSIAFSFTPKVDLPSVDTVWGNDFDHPVRDRLPPGFNTAFKIVKEFIDPGLECDAYADEPWLYGPSLSCWFAFGVGDKEGESGSKQTDGLSGDMKEKEDVLHEGATSDSGWAIRSEKGIPENSEKRRKHFLSHQNRELFTFEAGRTYHGDFYNPYLDFGNFALKLPGFSIKVIKYIDEKSHRLRYVFKNRKTGDVYFCVNLNLLWGDELKEALGNERKVEERHAGAEAGDGKAEGEGADTDVAKKEDKVNGIAEDHAESQRDSVQTESEPAPAATSEPEPEDDPESAHAPPEPKTDNATPQPAQNSHTEEALPEHDQVYGTQQPPPRSSEPETRPETTPEAGMKDKPAHLAEGIRKTSIQDTLQDTASSGQRSGRAGALDEGVD